MAFEADPVAKSKFVEPDRIRAEWHRRWRLTHAVLWPMAAVGLVLFVITLGFGLAGWASLVVAGVTAASTIGASWLYWRCPRCGGWLPQFPPNPQACTDCGADLK